MKKLLSHLGLGHGSSLYLALVASGAIVATGTDAAAQATIDCTNSNRTDAVCASQIQVAPIQASPALFKFQARVSQAKLPMGDGKISRVWVNIRNGRSQALCTETFADKIQVRDSVMNLDIGAGCSALADKIAESNDLYFQVCIGAQDNCLKEVRIASVPFAIKATYAQKAQEANMSREAVNSHFAHYLAADANIFTNQKIGKGFFDAHTPSGEAIRAFLIANKPSKTAPEAWLQEVTERLNNNYEVNDGYFLWRPVDQQKGKRLHVAAGILNSVVAGNGGLGLDQVPTPLEELLFHAGFTTATGRVVVRGDGQTNALDSAGLRVQGLSQTDTLRITGADAFQHNGPGVKPDGTSPSSLWVADGKNTYLGGALRVNQDAYLLSNVQAGRANAVGNATLTCYNDALLKSNVTIGEEGLPPSVSESRFMSVFHKSYFNALAFFNQAAEFQSAATFTPTSNAKFQGPAVFENNVTFTGAGAKFAQPVTFASNQTFEQMVNSTSIAENAVTSWHIADGTIAAADMAANSVNSSSIADGSVTSADIANGTITAADMAANSVNSSSIADNSVTSADIANGTIAADDMQPDVQNQLRFGRYTNFAPPDASPPVLLPSGGAPRVVPSSTLHCALMVGGYWHPVYCPTSPSIKASVACSRTDSQRHKTWYILRQQYAWEEANEGCQGNGMVFDVPSSPADNAALANLIASKGSPNVWINFAEFDGPDNWRSISPRPLVADHCEVMSDSDAKAECRVEGPRACFLESVRVLSVGGGCDVRLFFKSFTVLSATKAYCRMTCL